ncbi:hypothetical protein Dimus_032804 [Dionaea muscipula]
MAFAKTKRESPGVKEPEAKRVKSAAAEAAAAAEPESSGSLRVVLNPADCNLDFNIEDDLTGHALYEAGFAYCWSGARANVGISRGKYCFGCKILYNQSVNMEETPIDQQHLCRIGISRGDDAVGNLGETENSYGFGGTGKFSNAGKFSNYGGIFGVGDTIVCTVDLESKPASIGFSKNGKWLGIAKHFNAGPQGQRWESAFFPHVLLKNVAVQMQFSTEDGLVSEEGYKPWASAIQDKNAVIGPSLSEPKNCEVLMMVGLPASGKSTWAEKWVKEYPEKRYVLLGTNLVLDQMKVPGLTRKHNYGERFDRLMDRATEIFNTLLSRASRTPRNYILDQTNVYKSARRRKLKPFSLFHKIAVVVFPTLEELRFRSEKRFKEMGKEVPPEAVNEMLANYVLPMSKDMPHTDEYFDQVIFTELDRVESQRCLDEMKRNLAAAASAHTLKNSQSVYSRGSSAVADNTPWSPPAYLSCTRMPQSIGDTSVTSGSWQSVPKPQHISSDAYQPLSHVAASYGGPEQSGKFDPYYKSPLPIDNPGQFSGYGDDSYRTYNTESRANNYGVGSDFYHGVSEPYSQRAGGSRTGLVAVPYDTPGLVVSYNNSERSAPQRPHNPGRNMYSEQASRREQANLAVAYNSHSYSSQGGYSTYPADVRPMSYNQTSGSYGSSYRSYPTAHGTFPSGSTYNGDPSRARPAFPPRYY